MNMREEKDQEVYYENLVLPTFKPELKFRSNDINIGTPQENILEDYNFCTPQEYNQYISTHINIPHINQEVLYQVGNKKTR